LRRITVVIPAEALPSVLKEYSFASIASTFPASEVVGALTALPAAEVPVTALLAARVPVVALPTGIVVPVTLVPLAARVPVTTLLAAVVPVVVVPAAVVPIVAEPAGRVAAAAEPTALVGDVAADAAAVVGAAPVVGVDGRGVSVAEPPPQAARMALVATPPASVRKRRRPTVVRIASRCMSITIVRLLPAFPGMIPVTESGYEFPARHA
jgi:hypothetical protein